MGNVVGVSRVRVIAVLLALAMSCSGAMVVHSGGVQAPDGLGDYVRIDLHDLGDVARLKASGVQIVE